jgi:hypothetical protein
MYVMENFGVSMVGGRNVSVSLRGELCVVDL